MVRRVNVPKDLVSAATALPRRLLKNTVFTTAAIALVACLLLAGFLRRPFGDRARLPTMTEAFNTSNTIVSQLPANWKGPKTPLIAMNGLHWFFSDGALSEDTDALQNHVSLTNSQKDVVCYYTVQTPPLPDVITRGSTQLQCRNVRLQEITAADTRQISSDLTCSNSQMTAPPLDDVDAQMRILSAQYYFHRRCLTMEDVKLTSIGAVIVMELPAAAFATKVFALLRPVYVKSLNSRVYVVSYDTTGVDYPVNVHSIVNYDSAHASGRVRVVLRATRAYTRWERKSHGIETDSAGSIISDAAQTQASLREGSVGGASGLMQAAQSGSLTSGYLMLNTYYVSPMETLVDAPGKPAQGLTCVFRNSTRGRQPARGGVQLFSRNLSVSIDASQGSSVENTVRISTNNRPEYMRSVPTDATIVVAYSHNLIVVAAFSEATGRVRLQRFANMAVLNDSNTAPLKADLLAVKQASGLEYEPLALPNMLHVALDAHASL